MFNRSLLAVILCAWLSPSQAAVDPTRPFSQQGSDATARQVKPNPWQLQAVRISAQGRLAVINGINVREGERVRGAKVVEIKPGSVKLQQGRRQFQLDLGPSVNIKRNSQEEK
ncbi:MAG: hypothetical protein V7752_02850 [Halopseudomonas sp.]